MPKLMAALRSIPLWVRVSGIIALVLVGVVVSSMLLGSSGSGGHGGGRDRGSQMEEMDHNWGQTGPAVPSEPESTENPAPSGDHTPPEEGEPSGRPDDSTPTPSHGSGEHTPSNGRRDH